MTRLLDDLLNIYEINDRSSSHSNHDNGQNESYSQNQHYVNNPQEKEKNCMDIISHNLAGSLKNRSRGPVDCHIDLKKVNSKYKVESDLGKINTTPISKI